MGPSPRHIEPGELSTGEILRLLREGRRLVVDVELLGDTHEVVLRYADGTYYCDTPTALHRHGSADGMRACLEEQGYASSRA